MIVALVALCIASHTLAASQMKEFDHQFEQFPSSSNSPHRYSFPPYQTKEAGPVLHAAHFHKFDDPASRTREGSLVEGRFKIINKDHNTILHYSSIRANGTGSEDVAKIVELLQGFAQASPAVGYQDQFNEQNGQNGNANGGGPQYFPQ